MRAKRAVGWAALLLTVGALGAVGFVGCSKDDGPTTPVGGGGGGGGTFDSGTLNAPASFDHTFATAGSFPYHCVFHESLGMVGTVMVVSGATDSTVTVSAGGTRFTPSTVTIRPGGSVHWVITDGTHTVTSG
jgi:plastocyanin